MKKNGDLIDEQRAQSCTIPFSPARFRSKPMVQESFVSPHINWKFMAVYEKPFWREQGLSGAASSPDKVIATVFDISPAGAKHGILMSFVVGHKARTLSLSSQDRRKEEILDCLVSFFGPKAKDVTRLVEHTMMDEKYIGGCPVSNPAPGMLNDLGSVVEEAVWKGSLGRDGDKQCLEWIYGRGGTFWSAGCEGGLRVVEHLKRCED